MVRINRIIFFLGVLFLNSCIKSEILYNGTKVPKGNVFRNIQYFREDVYKNIDINYFYKKKYSSFSDDNYNNIDGEIPDVNRVIQFYPTGHFRTLTSPNGQNIEYDDVNRDPSRSGMRGIIYTKNNKIKIDDQFAFQGGGIYIATLSVKIEGDKIYILHDHTFNDVMECEVYEKWEKIPEDWKKYKPDW